MTSEKNSFSPLSQEKAVPLLRTESEKWLTKLSEEEIRAIKKYTKNSGDPRDDKFYLRLNAMLRGAKPENETLRYYAELISDALRKNNLQYDILCYRSMNFNPFHDVSTGDYVFPQQFMSTSVTKSGALKDSFRMIVRVPAGAVGAYIEKLSRYPKQREFLLDKDCIYQVTAMQKDCIELEVVV
ncbi:MAG: hypothetical protein IJ644_00195 [Oscillospiraceae bacterium]|nr:hypothetical protein [Oscillospiraceae bacterium]